MRVRCATCGEHLAPGTKFNSRKEDVPGKRYLGAIPVFQFYIRCPWCSTEITFKTDPANSGYAVESGGFDPRREGRRGGSKAEAGGGGRHGALEGHARDAVCEMAVDAAQEEMRSLKSRHARVTPEQLLKSLSHNRVADDRRALQELEEDEKLIRSTKFRCSKDFVSRIEEDEEEEDFFEACLARSATTEGNCQAHKKQRQAAPVVSLEGCTGMTLEAKGKEQIDKNALQLVCYSYDDDDIDYT
jgi:DNA-directed RNA polymerase subunit RPC12/RpoP